MPIYRIGCLDDDPHWAAIFVEADTPDDALAIIARRLANESKLPETVWAGHLKARSEWTATAVARPFVFILGQGCR